MRKTIFYYLLFILVYAGLYFILSFYYMDYEDHLDTFQNEQTRIDIIITQTFLHIISFPFGLFKLGFFNLIANCILNPLFIGWTFQKLFKEKRTTNAQHKGL